MFLHLFGSLSKVVVPFFDFVTSANHSQKHFSSLRAVSSALVLRLVGLDVDDRVLVDRRLPGVRLEFVEVNYLARGQPHREGQQQQQRPRHPLLQHGGVAATHTDQHVEERRRKTKSGVSQCC